MELCSLRLAVGSVTVRSDPAPAQAQLDKFLKATEPPEMQPFLEAGKFGGDVGQATLKLNEDVLDKGDDVFNQDSPDDSENWLRHAEKIGAVVDRYRGMDVEREKVGKKMTVLRKRIDGARTRIRLLADARTRLAGADDKVIDDVRTAAQSQTFFAVNAAKEGKDVALVDDPAFKQLLAEAEGTIQGRVAYKRFEPPIATTAARGGSGTGLLFAPRVDVPDPNRVPAPQGPSSVFFALARGVLYALEDIEGRVLWATRVGIDGDSLPVQLPGNALHPDLVLVVSNDGIHAALTARIARTGEAVWHQALPSPVIGRPVIVGQRVFVPLSEVLAPDAENAHRLEQGVVWEIEIANGAVVGRIVLGRPLGGSAARRPGTGQLFFPAEAKGVYVFDVEKIGADGSRIDPAYLGIIPTDHTAGTLRGEPVITAGEGETPSYLVLSVTDGLESMKLRAYPLSPADQPPAIQGVIPPPILLAGWSWFPPYCDTEKLAVVSDRGEFGLFGIKQAGNLDIPLFVLPPSPYLLPDIRMPARGQIVHADEHDFWFLARGLLYHLKLGFDAERGLRLVQRGEPISIGEPLQPAQVNARGDFAMVVTQASASASCRATAIDLRIGKVRWQRQLGLIAQGDPIRLGDAVMLMDHDGGLYKIDAGPLARSTDESWLIEEKWLVARPLNDLVEASHFLSGGDGSSVYAVLATRAPQGARIVVRRYVAGQPIEERSAALPAPFAGNPIVLGKHVIIPLANGMLYRMNLTTDRPLDDGPTWRAERISTQAICHLAAINEGEFLATDGARSLNRWRWTVEQDYNRRGGLNLAERIAAPPVVYTDGNDQRVFVFDIRNNATLWDADRLTAMNPTTLRAWRAGAMGTLPSGTLTNGPFFERDAKGKPRIVFVVDKVTVVWLDPNLPAPQWIAKPNEVGPGDNVVARPAVFGDRLYLTHRAGKCVSLDLERGESRDELTKLRGSTVPSGSVIALEGLLLVPLSDGTLLLQSNGPKRLPKLPMIWLPLPPLGAMVPLPLQP
jgi:outer membrane protein assembly factor BamB